MAKLSINLLPPELEAEKNQKKRFSNVLKFSIIFLIVVVAATATILSLRLSQNIVLSNVTKDLETAKSTLSSPDYNRREGLVITLKNRLDSISTLLGQETYGSYAFNLISDLATEDVRLSSFSVDGKGIINTSIETASISSLETFLNKLITPEDNQKKVASVSINGISRTATEAYRTDLSITLVGGGAKPK